MQQKVAKDPGVADPSVKPREVERVGVLGAGIMGSGIAGAHVRRGVPVLMLDTVPAALEKGVGNIAKSLQARVEIGRMKPEEVACRAGQAQHHDEPEADGRPRCGHRSGRRKRGGEDADLSRTAEHFAAMTRSWRPTPRRSRSRRMAKAWKKPENFAGMHFFNPVDRMQLVEVIRGEKTSDATDGDAGRPGQARSARRRSWSAIAPASW